jgi:hypothetical protein
MARAEMSSVQRSNEDEIKNDGLGRERSYTKGLGLPPTAIGAEGIINRQQGVSGCRLIKRF